MRGWRAAEFADRDDNGDVVLWGSVNGHDVAEAPVREIETATLPTSASQVPMRRVDSASAAPTIRQSWPIDGGEIVFELRSEHALPASAFPALGDVVAQLEALARSLASETLIGSTGEIDF